jgi:hypothetical protein
MSDEQDDFIEAFVSKLGLMDDATFHQQYLTDVYLFAVVNTGAMLLAEVERLRALVPPFPINPPKDHLYLTGKGEDGKWFMTDYHPEAAPRMVGGILRSTGEATQ